MDRLVRSVVGTVVLLVAISFGLYLLQDLLAGASATRRPVVTENPITVGVAVLFIAGLAIRLSRWVRSGRPRAGRIQEERRSARSWAADIAPWSGARSERPRAVRRGRRGGRDA